MRTDPVVSASAGRPAAGGLFYGWWIVLASTVGLALCQSPVAFLTLGAFIKPLGASFGWGRGEVSLALSAGAVAVALSTPLVGRLIDRVGAKRVLVPSMAGFGLLMMSLSLLTPSIWHFYAVYVLIGIVGAGANNVSYMGIISAWFIRHRGIAVGIAAAGVGLGIAVDGYVAQELIVSFGWRTAYVGLGTLVLAVGLPIAILVIRERPSQMGLQPDGEPPVTETLLKAAPQGYSRAEALRQPSFWLLVACAFVMALSLHGAQIHFIPLMTDHGVSPRLAALGFSVTGIATILARISVGLLFDRFFAPHVAVVVFSLAVIGMGLMIPVHTAGWEVILIAGLIGFGGGAESDVLSYLTSRYVGIRCFGELYGFVFAAFMLGTALGPSAFGFVFDFLGSYAMALGASMALAVLMLILLAAMSRYPEFEPSVERRPDDEAGRLYAVSGSSAPLTSRS